MRKHLGQKVWFLNGNDIKEGNIISRSVPKFVINENRDRIEIPVKQTFSSKEEIDAFIRKSKIRHLRAGIHSHQVAIRDYKRQINNLYK